MGEAIEYHFDNDYLLMKGQSFNFELSWNKVYKVTKTKNWILIWQNNQIATPIPRRDIDEELITHLRGTLNGHKVKNNL
ncbi:MAG: YcxB family protein [Chitinophagaceae bacterium]|nr:YcxB family protein [Chitinophagaceae bacterium]